MLLSWFAMNSCKQKQNAILMLNHHFTTKVRSDTFIQWRFTKVQPQISSFLELKYQAALATRKKLPYRQVALFWHSENLSQEF